MSEMESKANTYKLRVKNAKQLVVVCNNREVFKRGKAFDQVVVIENGGMIVDHDGKIIAVDKEDVIHQAYNHHSFDQVFDASQHCVLPGFVDAHTHPVWSGDRVHEFAMKLAGATYMDIHKAGGGIHFTVRHVHQSSEEELESLFIERLNRMIKFGTTVIDAKSGYGLDLKNEVKMLKVLHSAQQKHPMDIVANYCGAHSVPKGSNARDATQDIINNQIPAIKQLKDNGEISPEFIDVFCEKGVFEIEDSEAILRAGQSIGLKVNFHGDELNPIQAAEMAARIQATSVSHLECISDEGISSLAQNNVVGVLLPTTAYVLRIHPPPARKMIDNDVIVALGSDFNPNAHCMSMPHVMNLACVMMKMTINEALNAATINAAAAVNRSASNGSLEVGKIADLVMLKASTWEHIVYQLIDPPITHVFKAGVCVYQSLSS